MHNAYLYIDEFKFPVKYLEYNFRQFTGTNNKPNTRVFGGEFSFTFDIDNKKAIHLIEWMLSSTMQKNGYIEIMDFNQTSIAFKLEFANAYATSQQFHYDAFSNLPLQSNVTVTCGALRVGKEVTYLQTWNPEDPFIVKETKVVTSNDEPEFVRSFMTDLNNNQIDDYNTGDKILLNIETRNTIGKTITLNLNDKTHDFKHIGVILQNDILKNYPINNNLEQVKLEVIDQQ